MAFIYQNRYTNQYEIVAFSNESARIKEMEDKSTFARKYRLDTSVIVHDLAAPLAKTMLNNGYDLRFISTALPDDPVVVSIYTSRDHRTYTNIECFIDSPVDLDDVRKRLRKEGWKSHVYVDLYGKYIIDFYHDEEYDEIAYSDIYAYNSILLSMFASMAAIIGGKV